MTFQQGKTWTRHQHYSVCVYIYIHIYVVRSDSGPIFGILKVRVWQQFLRCMFKPNSENILFWGAKKSKQNES